ncbi:MAG: ATP-binding protein [Elusimicrobiota bacterium]|nr:ATP-binding protein [Endomicrobiia bacterium]MDW8166108.1 ATP-binding protein [Elusimicrobiota bacterium]
MKNSLFRKVFGYNLVLMFLYLIIFLFIIFRAVEVYYKQSLIDLMRNINYKVAMDIEDFYSSRKDFKDLDIHIKKIKKQILSNRHHIKDTRITVLYISAGKIIPIADTDVLVENVILDQPEIKKALEENVGVSFRYSLALRKKMLYVAEKFEVPNIGTFVVRTSCYIEFLDKFIETFGIKFILYILIMILIGILLAFLFSLSITMPVKQLISLIDKISQGNFEQRINIKRKDEIGILAQRFNKMIDEIKNLTSSLVYEKEKIKNIFLSIQEGIALINKDGKILLFNDKFKKIIGENLEDGYDIKNINFKQLNSLIKEFLQEGKLITKKIELNGSYYFCSISFMTEEEFVVLLYDITEYEKLQNLKEELTSCIVHDVKTPIMNIRSSTEILQEKLANIKDYNLLQKFFDIIFSNINRINLLVNNLLLFSKIENKGLDLNIELVDLKKIIDDLEIFFKSRLEQKGLELKLEIQKNLKPIKADKFKLEQAFINIVDNSIKYTDKGFIKVTISQDEIKTYIEVEDTGIGIPEEFLPKVFDEFFVVDRLKSAERGGTGLGLAIVKNIIKLHKGEIILESKPEVGTKFKIVLNNEL